MEQDKERYRDRISDAVVQAVIAASRPHPTSGDIHIDLNAVFDGITRAMATLAWTGPNMVSDREQAAEIMDASREWIDGCLRHMADKIRAGEPPDRPKAGPILRVVK